MSSILLHGGSRLFSGSLPILSSIVEPNFDDPRFQFHSFRNPFDISGAEYTLLNSDSRISLTRPVTGVRLFLGFIWRVFPAGSTFSVLFSFEMDWDESEDASWKCPDSVFFNQSSRILFSLFIVGRLCFMASKRLRVV